MDGNGSAGDVVPVFFLSDSTGISAETMGNALLIQFPDVQFERTLIPFISSLEEARDVVAQLDRVLDESPRMPLVFATAASDEVRLELLKTRCPVIDFFGLHMERVEDILETHGVHKAARLHGVQPHLGRHPAGVDDMQPHAVVHRLVGEALRRRRQRGLRRAIVAGARAGGARVVR